jgi:hypothetical protein
MEMMYIELLCELNNVDRKYLVIIREKHEFRTGLLIMYDSAVKTRLPTTKRVEYRAKIGSLTNKRVTYALKMGRRHDEHLSEYHGRRR